MNKEQLETNMAALKLLQSETNDKARDYQNQIAELEKQIEDINKPELTPMQLDDIYEAVEAGVEKYDFSDTDNYNIEYGIEYDNKVYCENLELQHSGDLVEMIVEKVSRLFKEADAPEDTPEKVKYDDELNK